jgi:outer membrane protein
MQTALSLRREPEMRRDAVPTRWPMASTPPTATNRYALHFCNEWKPDEIAVPPGPGRPCLPSAIRGRPAGAKDLCGRHGRVFEAHPQTQQQQAALKAEEKKVTDQLQRIEKDIRALADKLKDQQARFDDPTLAASQRDAIRAEGQKTGQEIQAKQAEGQQLMAKTQNEVQQRVQKLRAQIGGDIARVSAEIARKKGGTLVYDKSSLVYSDPAYDITSEVLTEVTKGKPAAPAPR